jgi:hypothetical protein
MGFLPAASCNPASLGGFAASVLDMAMASRSGQQGLQAFPQGIEGSILGHEEGSQSKGDLTSLPAAPAPNDL